MRRASSLAISGAFAALVLTGPAFAQSRDALREECRAQNAYLRGPGQREVVSAHVRACVQAKIKVLARAAVTAPTSSSKPFHLLEFTPWLVQARAAAQAKGAIYFVGGFNPTGKMFDAFRLGPYFLKSLADDGWDIVFAKYPRDGGSPFGFTTVGGAAQTIRNRVAALRAQGYKRVVAGGHSWGGWAALMAARDGMTADALIVSGPNTFGPKISPISGGPNTDYNMSATEFGPLLSKIKTPTVLILPEDNVWDPDPALRGEIAEKHFAQANVPHIVIAKPPGFFGHYAGWLPIFDYAYGGCIDRFLDDPAAAAPCVPPPLVNNDFRSIFALKQVADADQKRISSDASLVGKKFVAYTLRNVDNKHFDYAGPGQRITMLSDSEAREPVVFRDNLQCVGKTCSLLVRWSENQILEFNPASGAIEAWWIEDR